MYQVLVFVYENYWGGDDCPDREQLGRRLSLAGFERQEIMQALAWLDDLHSAAQGLHPPPAAPVSAPAPAHHEPLLAQGMRVYSPLEMDHLGAEGIGCIRFLETAGALPQHMRELVIDRAMAVPDTPLALHDLKVIVMMVYWRLGATPDALVLDELCDDPQGRVAH
ncbi:MAG: DUF494 domain-containing protein [Pseudomonadota bacterium]|nr:DUF494 domain-containing protein [Pseudomonadota bacterium]